MFFEKGFSQMDSYKYRGLKVNFSGVWCDQLLLRRMDRSVGRSTTENRAKYEGIADMRMLRTMCGKTRKD